MEYADSSPALRTRKPYVPVPPVRANFFNFAEVQVAGYVTSEGKFSIYGKIEIDIYLGPLHLNAGASLLLSNDPMRFNAAVWGSLDFELDLGFFKIDFTLAGFRGEIDITAPSAYLAARVTVMGISVSGSYLWYVQYVYQWKTTWPDSNDHLPVAHAIFL